MVILVTMPFRVEQKIGNQVYIYEAVSVWDPSKKQSRQKRRYLGKKDATTGEVVAVRPKVVPRASRDYGHVYLLSQLANRAGLTGVLRDVFPGFADVLLELAFFQVAEARPLYLFRAWLQGCHSDLTGDFSSQRLSELVEELGRMDRERERFFSRWADCLGNIRGVVFDITSLSSYSQLIDLIEWGHNRDGEKLPQMNLGVVFAQPVNLPVAYQAYPGSIPDVRTIHNTLIFMEEIGLKDIFFVLDRGFFSQADIGEMNGHDIRFVIPMPFTSRPAKAMVSQNHKKIASPVYGFCCQDRTLFHMSKPMEIQGQTYFAHLYFDETRRATEIDTLIRRIVELEAKVAEKTFYSRHQASSFMEETLAGSGKLFTLSLIEGKAILKRRTKAISRAMNRMGHTILLTNDETLTRDDLLLLYQRRNLVEHLFDVMKNELDDKRIRVRSRTALEGRVFLCFLALILYAILDNAMREKDLYRDWTVTEILYELRKLRSVEMTSGKTYTTEITKRQRTLLQSLNIDEPTLT